VRVVVVVANHLQLSDIQAAGPNLRLLADRSGMALVNTGLLRSTSPRYMAIGAGGRLNEPDGSPIFHNADESLDGQSAKQTYEYQMGRSSDASVLCIGFPRLIRANSKRSPKTEKLGLLGDVFHENGLETAVIGNSDVPGEEVRGAPVIAMDRFGSVDYGSVGGSVVKSDPESPSGYRDDLEAMGRMVRQAMSDKALIVVELGDFNRTEALRYKMSDAAYEASRKENVKKLDAFIGEIRPEIARRGASLILCSPERAKSQGYYSDLSPLIVYKPGGEPGVLVSGTTRCRGLLNNTDVGPTILRSAGLKVPKAVLGQPCSVVGMRGNCEWLSRMEMIASRNYAFQTPVLVLIAAIALLIVTLSELALRWKKSTPALHAFLGVCLLCVVSIPGALLLTDGMDGAGAGGYLFRLLAAVAVFSGFAWAVGRVISLPGSRANYAPIAVVQIITALLLLGDALLGNPLLRWSILSCDHITGIRFYGIGNEYMGVLIGGALMGPMLLLRMKYPAFAQSARVPRSLVFVLMVWFALVSFVVGYPGLGANVGGLITAVVTFGVALIALTGTKFEKRHILAIAASVVLITGVFAAIDILSPGGHGSHLGRTLAMVNIYGWSYIWNLIVGKLSMHMGIIATRQAYIPIIASIPFLIMYRNRVKSEKVLQRKSGIMNRVAMPSVFAGVVVAFLFNDSGIVPAALIFALYMVSALELRLQGAQS
jgi:hypothetical protein